MNINTNERMVYSEVYGILSILNKEYIKKIPIKLYNIIKRERLDTYNPVYDISLPLSKQKLKRESFAMLVLLYLNYWCQNKEEKEKLNKMLKFNSDKKHQKMKEMYSSENIFKNISAVKENVDEKMVQEIINQEEKSMVESKKDGFFKRILKKIALILKK